MDNGPFRKLIPQPRQVVWHDGVQPACRALRLELAGLDGPAERALRRLAGVILGSWLASPSAQATRLQLILASRADLRWVRRLDPAVAGQAYELELGPEFRLTAITPAGLRLGLQTLRQVLEDFPPAASLPRCRVRDWPRLAQRGVHYDLAREMECRPAHLRAVIERVAYFKLNQLHLYLENKFAFPSCPEVAPPGSMTPDQARDLCAYGQLFGVTVIPQLATLGHVEGFLHGPYARFREEPADSFNLCPSHPEVRPWLAGMIADAAEAFRSPYLHLGYDESHSGHCPRCRQQGPPAAVLAAHLNWLNGEVQRHHAQTMVYGDKFLSREDFPLQDAANGGAPAAARAALAQVARDIIITNWHYTAPYSGTTRALVQAGFTVYGVTDTGSYWHDSIPVNRAPHWIAETIERDLAEGAVGAYNCTWEHYRGQVFDHFWYFHGLAAERYWTDQPHDYVTWGDRFAARFWDTPVDYFSDLAGLAEATPINRRQAFLDSDVLDLGAGAALTPLWPSWGQAAYDFPEVGAYLVAQAKTFRARAQRNADTLAFLDLPGELIRYVGTRVRERQMLERALAAGDRTGAQRALGRIGGVAAHLARRLEAAYRQRGVAVVDRERLQRHVANLDACRQRVAATRAAALKRLTVGDLVAAAQELAVTPTERLTFRVSPLLPRPASIAEAAPLPAMAKLTPVGLTGFDQLTDIRHVHHGQDGLIYLKATPRLPRAGAGWLRFGADGPVKVWVNGVAAGCEPAATNPAVTDQYAVAVNWRRGRNEVVLALCTNQGRAWGVMARVAWADQTE